MAKDLPYFKFIISEWNDGDITLCSLEAQGLFINLCSLYWSQEGKLSLSKSKRRFKCDERIWKELIDDKIIKIDHDQIVINFLKEQLKERGLRSETNSDNGKLGGRPRKQDVKAIAFHDESEMKANESNIEKRREEENREEESSIETFGQKSKFHIGVKKVYLHDKAKIIYDLSEYFKATNQLEQLTIAGYTKFDSFIEANPGKVFNDDGHVYNSFLNYSKENSTTSTKRYSAGPV